MTRIGVAVAVVAIAATAHAQTVAKTDTLVVFDAGSLARPLAAALDSFAAAQQGPRVVVQQENAGSLETARKITELGRTPDVIALADYEVFPRYLAPAHVAWYAGFARNRMVITYSNRSKGANEISAKNWYEILTRQECQVGRSDPNLDPAGYRALLVFQLAEREYHIPGLGAKLLANAPPRNVRPKSADLTALVQTGDLDYAWEYESVATAAKLPFIRLPSHIDLSDPADSTLYAQSSVRILGNTPSDTVVTHGEAILYALSVPIHAPHAAVAERFVTFLLSDTGRRILRQEHLDALEKPIFVGRPHGAGQ